MNQFHHTTIYNASAGAGKTYTMVREILVLLLKNPNPNYFQHILAVTFTNKAANEMKGRIIKRLLELIENKDVNEKEWEDFEKDTHLNKEEISEKSKIILRYILHNYGRFSMSTIDKFNLKIIRSFSRELGLGFAFNLEIDSSETYANAINEMLAHVGEENRQELTQSLLRMMRDKMKEGKSYQIQREIKDVADKLFNDNAYPFVKALQELDINTLIQRRQEIFLLQKAAKESIIENAKKAFELAKSQQLEIADFANGNSGLLNYFMKLKAGEIKAPTKTVRDIIEESKYASGKASDEARIAIESIFPELSNYYENCLKHLPNYILLSDIWKNINTLTLSTELKDALKTYKKENSLILVSDFNQMIYEHIKEHPSAYIYEKMGNRYHHYFIDEFQDTSLLQWSNLQPLILNPTEENHSVMLVGDPKQSIYRFRGGNPKLFISLNDNEMINTKDLPENWRSYQNIVAFNNQLFVSAANFLPEGFAKLYQGAKQIPKGEKGGYVQLNAFHKGRPADDYIESTLHQILENVKNAQSQGFLLNEIVILCRKKSEIKLVAEFLQENDYRVQTQDSLILENHPDIRVLMSAIQWKNKPKEPMYFWRWLEALVLSEKLTAHQAVEIFNQNTSINLKNIENQLNNFHISIKSWNETIVSLYEWIERLMMHWSIKHHQYTLTFLDEILKFSERNTSHLELFIEHWESKLHDKSVSTTSSSEEIQILTVHKSKGLEYPVVILPFADWTLKRDLYWLNVGEHLPLEWKNYPIKNLSDTTLLPQEIVNQDEQEKNEGLFEDLNVLYVALTRAKEQLYIITKKNVSEKSKNDITSQVLINFVSEMTPGKQEDEYFYGKPERMSKPEELKAPNSFLPETFSWSNRLYITTPNTNFIEVQQEARQFGQVIHEILAAIKSEEEIKREVQKAVNKGFIGLKEQVFIEQKIQEIVTHPVLKEAYAKDALVYCERDFLDEDGQVFRPDRISLTKNHHFLIDYKTGEPSENDLQQVKGYVKKLKMQGFEQLTPYLVYLGDEIEVKPIK